MTMELNIEGKVVFDDQISELIDLLLSVRGVAMIYRMEEGRSWMKVVGDDALRNNLKRLSARQRRLIEAVVFEKRSSYDVMVSFDMTDEEMYDTMALLRQVLAEAV